MTETERTLRHLAIDAGVIPDGPIVWRINLRDNDPRSPWVGELTPPRGEPEAYGQDTLTALVDGIVESIDTDPVYGLGARLQWSLNGAAVRGDVYGVELPA